MDMIRIKHDIKKINKRRRKKNDGFSKNAVFNLKRIGNDDINKNAASILLDDEIVIGVYKTVRDRLYLLIKEL